MLLHFFQYALLGLSEEKIQFCVKWVSSKCPILNYNNLCAKFCIDKRSRMFVIARTHRFSIQLVSTTTYIRASLISKYAHRVLFKFSIQRLCLLLRSLFDFTSSCYRFIYYINLYIGQRLINNNQRN